MSSAEPSRRVLAPDRTTATGTAPFDVPSRFRLAMVALGVIPLIHLMATLAPVVVSATGRAGWQAAWLSPIVLFVVPPLVVRIATAGQSFVGGRIDPASGAFLRWWFAAQCQVVFSRLPLLEELLRLIPGCYSMWLRLWGARIGALTYWSPGVAILDRQLLDVGDRVVFGAGVRVIPHVLAPDGHRTVLYLGRVSIGDDAIIGGYSTLLPGCRIGDRETTPPFRSIHAFSHWTRGRRRTGD